jgi:hypothetical protein
MYTAYAALGGRTGEQLYGDYRDMVGETIPYRQVIHKVWKDEMRAYRYDFIFISIFNSFLGGWAMIL